MATNSTGGVTLELQNAGYLNMQKQFKKIESNSDNAFRSVVKLLFNIKTIAQQKLKSDTHIVTSRLRNSIYVQTPNQKFANEDGNRSTYTDKLKNSFDSELKGVSLENNNGIVGTNVEYAEKIEFNHDSFLYYALKHADVDRMGRDIAKELLKGIK